MRLTRHPLFHDPAYPSSERLDADQKALAAEFNARVAAGSVAFHTLETCLCGGHEFDEVSTYDRYRVWQPVSLCRSCGLMFCQPRMTDDAIGWFYGSDFYRRLYNSTHMLPMTPEKFQKRVDEGRRRRDSIARAGDYQRVTTVGEWGCAAGWNLWTFHQDGKRVTGADYSPELTEAGRAMGMDIRTGPASVLAGEKFDVLIVSHVLEHMPDPLGGLRDAAGMLTEQGLLYVEVPDARDICLGLFQSAHLWYFTPTRLQHLAAQAGLQLVAQESYGGVHFSMIFRFAGDVALPDVSGEYVILRDRILSFERRERAKDLLKRLGLFSVARSGRNLLRRWGL